MRIFIRHKFRWIRCRNMSWLVLVRHSAVAVDTNRPSFTWALSEDGRSRCRTFAPLLSPYTPARFVASTEPKAMETARLLAEFLQCSWETAANLHEHSRRTVSWFAKRTDFEAAVARFFRLPESLVFGEETAVQAQTRFTHAVHSVLASYPNDSLAIVTHGTVLTLFIGQFNPEISLFDFWQMLTLPCAFVLNRNNFRLKTAVYFPQI
ncbi:MAG: histidine phosphatase family protein [Chloroflexi bacterium]|nr:MAG: histidine phosphatase family protein [Chloroflexota bacterium]